MATRTEARGVRGAGEGMTLNHENVERLRVAIIETPDEMFDYRTCNSPCGCVMTVLNRDLHIPAWSISEDLGITVAEESFLIGSAAWGSKAYGDMSKREATGANGKREALRRLSVILQRRFGSWAPK